MTGSLIVNNLAGLLIITSLLVIGARKPTTSACLYALQSLVLVLIFISLANTLHAPELYWWSISAFITKVVLVPTIMYRSFRKLADPKADGGVLSPAMIILIATVIVVLSYFAVAPVQLPMVSELKPALAVSLGHFMIGLLCIVSQRNILKQVFGYCLMENGAHLTLALLANRAPELVEIGIATDAIFAVIVMALMARKIHRTLNTLDVQQLTALKG
ncbi:hydrogenase 4 membrane subunit [Pectobacteriaceae bacterium CE70]|uniref:Hydrogenase 4 membrane subunit n=1 Tax=Serratia sp. (strain ATCC 39006) TaxID=104623 RepID=A0A2I5TA13_SERS3|nr:MULTISPECIES: hydrogenase 4 membrane subunit [Enterobacterales]WJV56665.1 hydrogenase 4 membrane subunit [Pectobacteriaceae bacterium C111]WJV63963.1 hydrogenase 4 membrane subunit [Pectobacteriaceae bacterium C52]WJV68376.1 hydrogenase 4 membrane subunit [Pectobacteriaceae bacterium CE70]WJY12307.1 hydrogenase 4 membrane subunit [Pectobacteriaceae bacterium C80]WJY13737.1 hydrogenase 4 membrane subunit [Pectobacteriaceae bacterium CE90]